MARVILLAALLGVGYDAYAHYGAYTRTVVNDAMSGIVKLGDALNNAASQPTAPAQPS